MKKVYVLVTGFYDLDGVFNVDVEGVYSSREKAEKVGRLISKWWERDRRFFDYMDVFEITIDEIPESLFGGIIEWNGEEYYDTPPRVETDEDYEVWKKDMEELIRIGLKPKEGWGELE